MILRKPLRRNEIQTTVEQLARAAFTLMEMLIVVAIIVALAGMGGYYFIGQMAKAKEGVAKAQISEIDKAVETYQLSHDQPPAQLAMLLQADQLGGPYLKSADTLTDPWGNQFGYNANAQQAQNGVPRAEIYTQAPSGRRISNLSK
jgi:general secretion pathway protein G